jgi:hypothetical protein
MKIELTVNLELPDSCESMSDGELSQVIFDNYTNFALCRHLEDCIKWTIKNDDYPSPCAEQIMVVHRTWADICEKSTFTVKRV